ncbi:trigger factor [Flavobacteriaceae bacterium]|mgnify:FL=1|jgi:trigger factor|nr:trigger factor [Flavobacteriaceae bacterium]MDC0116870.1 trigger factor [Flavobacteriaceae bacterium]|tara:strand:+ start:488 stop:1813 length:1326 start_codon:yes stop_codon:yes gene_type:complete
MKVSKKDIDKLNSVLSVSIEKTDYESKVEEVIKDYKKKANIPGFRKGHTPIGLIKKQYGISVKVDEINKLMQKGLSDYLGDEKLDILGNPLPVEKNDLDWNADNITFDFEIGLSPEFEVSLKNKKAISSYEIDVDKKMIDDQLKNIQNQYGKLIAKTKIEDGFEINGKFINEEFEVDNTSNFKLKDIKGKSNKESLKKLNIGDSIDLKTKDLFDKDSDLSFHLKTNDDNKDKVKSIKFLLNEINEREPADLNQDLFDKLFGKDAIKSVTELKNKLKSDAESNFINQTDQKLLNDVTEYLIDNTKFDLPVNFLKKWMQTAGENRLDEKEAALEYEKSEKGLRYQLIESKIVKDNDIKIDHDQIKDFSKDLIKTQMKQYGQNNPEEKELESISQRILSNKDEVKRISDQLLSKKLIDLFKSNLKFKNNKVSYEKFIEMAYAKK